MAVLIKKYNITKSRLSRGLLNGFTVTSDGVLKADSDGALHTLFLARIDSSQEECPWGRFCFDSILSEESVLIVRAFASNDANFVNHNEVISYNDFILDPEIALKRKEKLFVAANASKFIGANDMLLYSQKGRYLWIYIQVLGEGRAELRNFKLYAPGDNFFHTFPEIYRSKGDFLHRYLSVFSSLYSDLQETVDSLENYIDIDDAPAEILPIFAKWLGIELDGNFLEEEQLRRLLKNAFSFIKGKGSRRVIGELVKLFLDVPIYIVEQSMVLSHSNSDMRNVYEHLYGKNEFGFTILIKSETDVKLHAKLHYLINQFKPLRTSLSIVFLGMCSSMDEHCYLDINANIARPKYGYLDQKTGLYGIVILQ